MNKSFIGRCIRLVTIILLASISSCSSLDERIYEQSTISSVKAWHIDFTFQSREDVNIKKSTGETEQQSVQKGYDKSELQFLDDLYYALKDDHKINLVKSKNDADGFLLVNTIYYSSGVPSYVTVTFTDKENSSLGRIKYFNKDSRYNNKVEKKVLGDAAELIADVIHNEKHSPIFNFK